MTEVFENWWDHPEQHLIPNKSCAGPYCQKILPMVCENTFDNFKDDDKTFIPLFDIETLSELVTVEKTLGGGKSGAYLFVVTFKNTSSKKKYVLKLYANAYSILNKVRDERPFREVYTQCAMSGSQGYNCLLGFARAPWSAVQDMFGLTTSSLYDSKLKRIPSLADGRTLLPVPTQVLFMIATFSSGVPLFDLDLQENGNLMPGVVLNLFSNLQKAERRLGSFTHWDLHADNIFVDATCSVRPYLPLAYIGKFSGQEVLNKLTALTNNPDRMAQFKALRWDVIMPKINKALYDFKNFNVQPSDDIFKVPVDDFINSEYESTAISALESKFKNFLNRKLEYPNVTLIDFDLANSDEFPGLDPVHTAKLNSPLPMAERTLSWLLKWIPAPQVFRIIEILFSMRKFLPLPESQSDLFHCIIYVIVALVYWDKPKKESYVMSDLAKLNQKCDLIVSQIHHLIKDVKDLSITKLSGFFVSSIQRLLPSTCEAPLYCGLSPVMTVNAVNVSAMLSNYIQQCDLEASNDLCQIASAFTSTTNSFNITKEQTAHMIKTVHGNLLHMNIVNFLESGRFLCPDDIELKLQHTCSPGKKVVLHAEINWPKVIKNENFFWRTLISQAVTKGVFQIVVEFLKNTEVKFRLKNGSDMYIDIETDLKITFYTSTDKLGRKFEVQIDDVQNKDIKGDPMLLFQLHSINIKKSGALWEVRLEMDYYIGMSLLRKPFEVLYWIVNTFFNVMPENMKILHVNQDKPRIQVIMSFPPSEDPLIPCLGLATDPKNINFGLNCLSSIFSAPTFLTQLTRNLSFDQKAFLRVFLNKFELGFTHQETEVPTSVEPPKKRMMPTEIEPPKKVSKFYNIWSITWNQNNKIVSFADVPQAQISSALKQYLEYYYSYRDIGVPESALPLLAELQNERHNLWYQSDRDTFNIEYVRYLAKFIETDVFEDAATN